ncbi:MAG: GAF domain-containing protein [Bacteroidetes bacterium]|nr:MAG: GAF domain-containing protein [Bacteroidota bacterium]
MIAFLLLMTWAVFRQIGRLREIISNSPLQEQFTGITDRLEYLLIVLFSAIFLTFAGLIVFKFFKIRKEEIYNEFPQAEVLETSDLKVESSESEIKKDDLTEDEIKSREEKITGCLKKQIKSLKSPSPKDISKIILSCLSKSFEITQAEIFLKVKTQDEEKFILSATYAIFIPEEKIIEFEPGEGLIGQAGKSGNHRYLRDLPDGYLNVKSGLGAADAANLLILPWKNQHNEVFAVLEIASFKLFKDTDITFLEELGEKIKDFYE